MTLQNLLELEDCEELRKIERENKVNVKDLENKGE